MVRVWVLWVCLGLCACGTPVQKEKPEISTTTEPTALTDSSVIDIEAFHKKAAAQPFQVVDVRTPEEFVQGHIPGAKNLPLDELLPTHPIMAALSKDEPVFFVCRSGRRSGIAAVQMASAGFQAVNVEGGTLAWMEKGWAVQTVTPE